MAIFDLSKERTDFSDYILLKNMLEKAPERVELTLVDKGKDLKISLVYSQDTEKYLETAAKDLIVNSYVSELDMELPTFPTIVIGKDNFRLCNFEIASYCYIHERKEMKLAAFLVFEVQHHEIGDSPMYP